MGSYNPGTQYRGDMYLFQGISGAGDAVGRGIRDRRFERKREQENMDLIARQKEEETKKDGRIYDAIAKFAVEMGYGSKDEVKTMSLGELQGHVRAMEAKTIAQERAAKDAREIDSVPALAEALLRTRGEKRGQQGPNPDGSAADQVDAWDLITAAQQSKFAGSPAELMRMGEMLGVQGTVRGQEMFNPRIVTLDHNGKQIQVIQTGPNASQILPSDDLTPAQKQRDIEKLQDYKREYLRVLGATDRPISDDMRLRYEEELSGIDQALEARGVVRRAPTKDGASAKTEPAPAAAPAKRFRLNATTGKIEPLQ